MIFTHLSFVHRCAGCYSAAVAATAALVFIAVSLRAQNPIDGFAPSLTAGANTPQVWSVSTRPDGDIIVGGHFSAVDSVGRVNLARLRPNGVVVAFTTISNAAPSDVIYQTALQSDGKILITGNFNAISGQPRSQLARLNADGSLDPNFAPVAGGGSYIWKLKLQSDGKILVSGDFNQIAGQNRSGFARLNGNGSIDAAFSPNPNALVSAIAELPDGKLIVGGAFTQIAGQSRPRIARLNVDGSLDPTFNPPVVPGEVTSVVVQPDGRIVIGGSFLQIDGQSRTNLARLETNGSLDLSFNPSPNLVVHALALQPDGKILVAGGFTKLGSTNQRHIGRVNPDGSPDASFLNYSLPNLAVEMVSVESDGKILIGGSFTKLGAEPRSGFAKLHADGSLDSTFQYFGIMNGDVSALALQSDNVVHMGGRFQVNAFSGGLESLKPNVSVTNHALMIGSAGAAAFALAVQPDGKTIVGGTFTSFEGTARNRLGRFNANGSVDTTFIPSADHYVYGLALQPDGKILVGGEFLTLNSRPHSRLGRLRSDGSIDDAFAPDINAAVGSIVLQPDGKILIGGLFTQVNGKPRNYLARLNADGTLDEAFNPNMGDAVWAIALRPNGKILVGGQFTSVNSNPNCHRLALLNSDGSLDATFLPDFNDIVYSIALFADGSFCVGGKFSLVGANTRVGFAKFGADNVLDPIYRAASDAIVEALVVQPDGKVMASGFFTLLNGTPRSRVARLSAHARATQLLEVNSTGTQISWTLGGSSPVSNWVRFESSTDNTSWTDLGLASFSNGSWRLAIPAGLPVGNVYVRARGVVPSSIFSSSSINESVRLAYIARNSVAPAIAMHPANRTITAGASTTFSIAATGTAPLSYQWQRQPAGTGSFSNLSNSGNYAGTTTTTLSLTGASIAMHGDQFRCVVSNGVSPNATSNAASLTVNAVDLNVAPTISAQPVNETQSDGLDVTFTVAASGFPTPSYQWQRKPAGAGSFVDIPNSGGYSGATSTVLRIAAIAPAMSDDQFRVVVRNGVGPDLVSTAVSLTVRYARLSNVSVRSAAGTGSQTLIVGFVVGGSSSMQLLVRGIGPTLGTFGVSGALADPRLLLFAGGGTAPIDQNDNWGGTADLAGVFVRTGAFSLAATSLDAALLRRTDVGGYSTHVSSTSGTGVALVEGYDADATPGAARLINVSARTQVGSGGEVLIAGFVIAGNTPKTVLIRAIGPTLTTFGVTGVLADPQLHLFQQAIVAPLSQSDDWNGTPELVNAFNAVGAFALPATSKDAALLATLPPGAYTAQCSGVGGTTGVALVEVYVLP
jgi:uncharacterized delta-60 repeat protein